MVDNERRALALGANAFHLKPVDREWLLDHADGPDPRRARRTLLLIVDDDEVSRYVLSTA